MLPRELQDEALPLQHSVSEHQLLLMDFPRDMTSEMSDKFVAACQLFLETELDVWPTSIEDIDVDFGHQQLLAVRESYSPLLVSTKVAVSFRERADFGDSLSSMEERIYVAYRTKGSDLVDLLDLFAVSRTERDFLLPLSNITAFKYEEAILANEPRSDSDNGDRKFSIDFTVVSVSMLVGLVLSSVVFVFLFLAKRRWKIAENEREEISSKTQTLDTESLSQTRIEASKSVSTSIGDRRQIREGPSHAVEAEDHSQTLEDLRLRRHQSEDALLRMLRRIASSPSAPETAQTKIYPQTHDTLRKQHGHSSTIDVRFARNFLIHICEDDTSEITIPEPDCEAIVIQSFSDDNVGQLTGGVSTPGECLDSSGVGWANQLSLALPHKSKQADWENDPDFGSIARSLG